MSPPIFILTLLFALIPPCQELGPLLVPLVAAFFGSGRQQVACDEKFSTDNNSGDEEESAVAGSRRKSRGKGRSGDERKVGEQGGKGTKGDEQGNNEGRIEPKAPQRQTDRQAGRQARESSPEWCRGARQNIRAVDSLCLGLLHGDGTQYESFMRGTFY